MRRILLLVGVMALALVVAAPAGAANGEKVKTHSTYHVPEELPDDLGQLNHGCGVGQYTLIEGTLKGKETRLYYPSRAAWEASEAGSTLTVIAQGSYRGIWDNDSNDRLYRLKAKGPLKGVGFFDVPGDEEEWTSLHLEWTGEFVDLETGEVSDWWVIDANVDNEGNWIGGVVEGTC